MKVLVTGGAGFIGSHSADQLVAAGHQVVVLDDLSSGSAENLNPESRFVRMSILDEALFALFEREKFDAVLHLAAQTIVPSSLARPDVDAQVNVLGTLQVLEGCRRTGVKKLVFSSSAAVYGDAAELPLPEEAAGRPASFYGLSKLTAEHYIQMYRELHGQGHVILRYANVYGDRQGDRGEGGVVSIFARSMLAGEKVTIFGDGLQTRDFIYVGDVAAANVLALTGDLQAAVLNVGTQSEVSVNCLAEKLAALTGYEAALAYQPARAGDIVRSMLRNGRVREGLKWAPATSLAVGLERTCRHMQGKEARSGA